MTGIHTGVVRFQDVKRNVVALQLMDSDDKPHATYVVLGLQSGRAEIGDELIGNMGAAGPVDLFNRTRHDHVHAIVQLVHGTREEAVAFLKH